MQFPQQPPLPHTQGLADSAIDAAWAVMPPDMDLETSRLLPVVVGAHPRSEISHRPLANRLVAAIRQWQRQHEEESELRLTPIVMTDLWYLNDRELLLQPSIAIGEPSLNAARCRAMNQSSAVRVAEASTPHMVTLGSRYSRSASTCSCPSTT